MTRASTAALQCPTRAAQHLGQHREDGSGELRLSGAPYKFRFTLSGRTLSIDFEAEALTDCEYEVAYIDTGLELTAGKGTATQGEKFTLNRTEK